MSLVRQVNSMVLLIDHEIKFIGNLRHLALIVLDIEVLCLLHQLLHARLAEELDERLIFRKTFLTSEKEFSAKSLVPVGNGLLGIIESLGDEGALACVKFLDIWAELLELLVVLGLAHRSGNDERSPGVVNEDGVHLIDNGEVMLALDEVIHPRRHIVPQIVETELVVGSEGNVAFVCLTAGIAVRLVLVDAVHRQSVEHVERSHPLGVTLGEVVIDGHHMDSLACEGVQEHRQCCHEGLSLTRRHLRNLALVENDTSDELDVIVDHIPGLLVSSGNPVVFPERLVPVDLHEIVGHAHRAVKVIGSHLDNFVLSEPSGG